MRFLISNCERECGNLLDVAVKGKKRRRLCGSARMFLGVRLTAASLSSVFSDGELSLLFSICIYLYAEAKLSIHRRFGFFTVC